MGPPSIDTNSPIYSSWGYYENGVRKSGHAVVISGYSFNDSALTITYTMRDPNYSSYQYVTTSISATDVYISLNGKSFKWDGTIYDIR